MKHKLKASEEHMREMVEASNKKHMDAHRWNDLPYYWKILLKKILYQILLYTKLKLACSIIVYIYPASP